MSLQGECSVPAGDVLAEEFAANCSAVLAAESGRIPIGDDRNIGVVAWADV